jgi:hypothetical protein
MTSFHEFLGQRLAAGGFTTEDALASLLPLMRQTTAAHRNDLVAPLAGLDALHVEGIQVWYEESQAQAPSAQHDKLRALDAPGSLGLEVVGEAKLDSDVNSGQATCVDQSPDRPARRGIDEARLLAWLRELGTRGRSSRSAHRHFQSRHAPRQPDVQSRFHSAR